MTGQFRLHVRAPAGTRIEETERLFSQVKDVIRRTIPADQLSLVMDNIGLPVGGVNLAFGDSSTIGPSDGEILVALNPEHHRSTWQYVKELRQRLNAQFPHVTFFFQPADIISQILSFGLPAPIDIQVVGCDLQANYPIAKRIEARVARDINRVVAKFQPQLPRGSRIVVRGQAQSMNDAFVGLGAGTVFAIALVYMLMVVNFQSWLDPLIIIMALPGALAGILWMLFITQTTPNVPALMGAIMCIGVATANSILLVTFANEQLQEGHDAISSALSAGFTRLHPVLMTALAMIIGMLPMAFGLGEGGEQNTRLGRAVIGGLSMSTLATHFFVPVVSSILRHQQSHVSDTGEVALLEQHVDLTMTSRFYEEYGLCLSPRLNPNPCLPQKCRLTGSGHSAGGAWA